MMDAVLNLLAVVAYGFIVALWVGFFLGLLEGWSQRAFNGFFVVVGIAVLANLLVQSPSEGASQMNWPFVLGTLPGYIVGVPTGRRAYDDMWGDSE